MLKITLCSLVGVLAWGFASCSITCPDGNVCSDSSTCCMTDQGYSCCPYPKATCCSDLAHCCPAGFLCNVATQRCEKADQPWVNLPMAEKEAAEKPSTPLLPALHEDENDHVPEQQKSTVVYCDPYHTCPDRTTCCRHPTGVWFCCPYYLGRCCLDGYHCCPYGYNCDVTYTHCVRQDLRYPFIPIHAPSSFPAALISTSKDKSSSQEHKPMTALTEASNSNPQAQDIRCDAEFYCPPNASCCKHSDGQWTCCPYKLGQCCADGKHCCEYGNSCDPTSSSCTGGFL